MSPAAKTACPHDTVLPINVLEKTLRLDPKRANAWTESELKTAKALLTSLTCSDSIEPRTETLRESPILTDPEKLVPPPRSAEPVTDQSLPTLRFPRVEIESPKTLTSETVSLDASIELPDTDTPLLKNELE